MPTTRVMTYNIKNDTPDEPIARWTPARREAVTGMIAAADADVVALQEVFAHQLQHLLQDLPQYAGTGVGREDGAADGEFAPLLWRTDRWRAVDSGTFWLSATPDLPSRYPPAHCTRICTWTVLAPTAPAGGSPSEASTAGAVTAGAVAPLLRVWNVHLDNGSEEAREFGIGVVLERIAARAAAEPGALDVLVGDFNAGPGSATLLAATARLRDARAAATTAPTGPGPTFHDWRPDSLSGLGPDDRMRIDHVLAGPGATVLGYDVPTPAATRGVLPSDHHPVVVDLEY